MMNISLSKIYMIEYFVIYHYNSYLLKIIIKLNLQKPYQ